MRGRYRLKSLASEILFDVGAAGINAVAVAADRPEVVLGCSDGTIVTRSLDLLPFSIPVAWRTTARGCTGGHAVVLAPHLERGKLRKT